MKQENIEDSQAPLHEGTGRHKGRGQRREDNLLVINFFLQEMGLKIMSNTNIKKPRVCPTTPLTTLLRGRGISISRPMLTFAQPHKLYNSKHLTAFSSYMGGLVFHVKAFLDSSQEAALAISANGGGRGFPVPKPVVLV